MDTYEEDPIDVAISEEYREDYEFCPEANKSELEDSEYYAKS